METLEVTLLKFILSFVRLPTLFFLCFLVILRVQLLNSHVKKEYLNFCSNSEVIEKNNIEFNSDVDFKYNPNMFKINNPFCDLQ